MGSQFIGVLSVAVWAFGLGFLMFWTMKKTIGVRVTAEEEKIGLDLTEHGESAYN